MHPLTRVPRDIETQNSLSANPAPKVLAENTGRAFAKPHSDIKAAAQRWECELSRLILNPNSDFGLKCALCSNDLIVPERRE